MGQISNKKLALTQKRNDHIASFYDLAISGCGTFIVFLSYAKDEKIKQPWIRAGVLNDTFGVALQQRINSTTGTQEYSFTLDEIIDLYYIIDIFSRFMISDLAEKRDKLLIEKGRATREDVDKTRETILENCQILNKDIKQNVKKYPRFSKALSILKQLEIVPFESNMTWEEALKGDDEQGAAVHKS
jgi:hypothetical protein